MLIKEFLEKREDRLTFPESYTSVQKESALKILESFQDIDVIPKKGILRAELDKENPNTVVISFINYAAPPSKNYKYRLRCTREERSIKILNNPVYTLKIQVPPRRR